MSSTENTEQRPVTVIVGATSKWQADGRYTLLVHGARVHEDELPESARWGLGGALAQRFAREGHLVVLTTRTLKNAEALSTAIEESGGACMTVELDLGSPESVTAAFQTIRDSAGDPEVLVYNAGYMAGRELPADQELMEHFPTDLFEVALDTAARGPFLVAKEVLPAMRKRGRGSFLFSNNHHSLRGRKRLTGESLYYPRALMRTLSQALAEEYSPYGVHVANVVVDGTIDSPGTRAQERYRDHPDELVNPASIAEAFYYLHQQDRSAWTHELQLTPAAAPMSH
jgi:NAD(P)-dependent dehydrogenase (short-subunit alcohol dehydrogenase family)